MQTTIYNYKKQAMKTCLPSSYNWGYAINGIESEYYELKAKIKGAIAKEIRDGVDFNLQKSVNSISDEVGDCFWFLALMCELNDDKFENLFKSKNRFFIFKSVFKFFTQYGFINAIIYSIKLTHLISFLHKTCFNFDLDMTECLQRNISKLLSRKERNVIKGSGDER